ncbi:MAG: ankyrin repeat domain-containing protein [Synergistaceae bacterium]|jgi:ankyrin repeat protein|nr:ankyrin repeat domain-containing protein [Synergistaceae bacterium]
MKENKKSLLELLSVPGRSDAILEAIREGADVNETSENGFTPLMMAAVLNDEPSVVEALIDAGADIDAETREGMTALMWALLTETRDPDDARLGEFIQRDRRRAETATLLVKRGASLDVTCYSPRRKRWTPLLFATLDPDRNAAVISHMLTAGAWADPRTEEGLTPLFHAAAFGRFSGTLHDLIQAGAEVNARGNQEGREGWTPLFYALNSPCKSLPVVEELLKNGAAVNMLSDAGQTPLFFAALIEDTPAFVHLLLKAGADVHVQDKNGCTAVDCALSRNSKNVVSLLRKAEAAKNTTPL